MPQLGETVTEGTITKWFKKVGDEVKADDPLFEVSTDKVDTEVPSPEAGYLVEIRAAEGDTVAVGAIIAVIGGASAGASPTPPPAVAVAATPAPVPATPAPAAPAASAPAPQAVPAAQGAPTKVASSNGGVLLSPVVRKLLNDNNVDPSEIKGSGLGGRITREDVLTYLDARSGAPVPSPAPTPVAPVAPAPPAPATTPAAPGPAPVVHAPAPRVAGERDEIAPLSKIRRLTGDHMVMSKTVTPHAFSVVEVDYDNVDRVRNAHKNAWKQAEGFSLTYLPFICRSIVDALADFPHLNASVGAGELIVHKYIDLGIAVDLDYQGLLVPVVRSADTKRLRAIGREINDLATRARARKLSPDEIQGGTFTISNNGSAGSVLTAAIINQPQVAIISTDAVRRRPVVVELPGGGEAIVIHSVGNLAMSWDHRAFDGAYAANFLVKVRELLEHRDWEAEL